jgi:FkbM family methyltransferase
MRLISVAQGLVNRVIAPLDLRVVRRTAMGNDLIANVRRLLGRPPTLILDVGANVGQTLTSFRTAWPAARIVCFEPSPETYQRLSKLAAADPLAETHQLALSDVDGELSFREFSVSTANSLLEPTIDATSPEWVKKSTVTRVRSRRLDGWCAESGISTVDLLKIDT